MISLTAARCRGDGGRPRWPSLPGTACAVLFLLLLTPGTGSADSRKSLQAPGFSVDGYVHVQWRYDFHRYALPRHEFLLRRGRVEFGYLWEDKVGADMELGCDELEVTVKNAYVEYRVGKPLRFVAGFRKMPFSREELTPASRLPAIERSAVNEVFSDYMFLGRDIGLSVEGGLFGSKLPVGYALGVFNGNGDRRFDDWDDAKQFCERVTVTPRAGLTVGFNATQRNDSLTGELVTAYGGDASWQAGQASVEGEVLYGNAGPDRHMFGAWLAGAYRIGTFQPGLRLERLDPDLSDLGEQETHVTLIGNWQLHPRLLLKANFIADPWSGRGWGPQFLTQAQVSF